MSSIVIAEKPSQAKMYQRNIGNRYGQIFAARGHLFELLSPEELNPDWKTWSAVLLKPKDGWYPSALKDEADLRRRFNAIRDAAKRASLIYLATDPDREGEGIANDILAQVRNEVGFNGRVMRVLPLGEDRKSVEAAFEGARPAEEFKAVYAAYKARAQGDHIFNLSLTRAATTLLGSGKGVVSVGRVITPTLGIVCGREIAIRDFKPESYFVPQVTIEGTAGRAVLSLPSSAEERILDRTEAERLAAGAAGYSGPVSVRIQAKTQLPPRLFSMSTLQVEASRRWKWGAKKTSDVLQVLYSQYQVTTYPRSSEVSLPEAEINNVPAMNDGIQSLFGAVGYDPVIRKKKGYFSDKDLKGASHFAIVPNINTIDQWGAACKKMSNDERKLFELISRRYLAAIGPDRHYDSTELSILVDSAKFKATGSVETKPGWKEALGQQVSSNSEDDQSKDAGETALPAFKDGDPVRAIDSKVQDKQTTAPPRITDGGLIDLMVDAWKLVDDKEEAARLKEAKGIGTTATRQDIVHNLLQRGFIKAEKGKLFATETGLKLYEALGRFAPMLLDIGQTARMEMLLDQVQSGDAQALDTVEQIIGTAQRAIDGLTTASKEGVGIDMGAARRPTAKMLKAARSKAKREGKRLPKGVSDSFTACSEYLSAGREKNADGGYQPTAKQISFANRVAQDSGNVIPPECLKDGKLLSAWIDEHKGSAGANGSGGPKPPSPKQISFAENISKSKGLVVPAECMQDGNKLSDWISQHK